MSVNQNYSSLYKNLITGNAMRIQVGGSTIDVRILSPSSHLSLSASVYEGGDFIPLSVRKCVEDRKAPFEGQWISTKLVIEEQEYQVLLTYNEVVPNISVQDFKDLLEEFSWQADEWRYYLDEHDKNDLVYVRVTS